MAQIFAHKFFEALRIEASSEASQSGVKSSARSRCSIWSRSASVISSAPGSLFSPGKPPPSTQGRQSRYPMWWERSSADPPACATPSWPRPFRSPAAPTPSVPHRRRRGHDQPGAGSHFQPAALIDQLALHLPDERDAAANDPSRTSQCRLGNPASEMRRLSLE
jgi:hypothetical protein